MLVKSDFTSKLAIIRLGSNSSISLANENEYFIAYSLVVIGFSNLSHNFANLKVGVPIADKIGRKVGIPSSKVSLVLNLMDIRYHNFSLKFNFDFLNF